MLTVTPVGVPSDAMRLRDRILLHEVHPVKLVTDIGSGVLCLYFLWEHSLSLAILFAAVPPLLASGLVLCFADLTALERTMLGNYLRRYMTPTMQALRLCGFLAMAIGAWYHSPLLLVVGLGIVAFGWLKGVIFA